MNRRGLRKFLKVGHRVRVALTKAQIAELDLTFADVIRGSGGRTLALATVLEVQGRNLHVTIDRYALWIPFERVTYTPEPAFRNPFFEIARPSAPKVPEVLAAKVPDVVAAKPHLTITPRR